MAGRVADILSKIINNNVFIDVCLISSFVALGFRSLSQQRDIETLETEKASLLESNKALKHTIWDSKQKLFAEASSPNTAIVPLSRLKIIFGEVVSVPSADAAAGGDAGKEAKAQSSSKILI